MYLLVQQQYGYQEEETRSLNSLDDNPAFPLLPSSPRSRTRGNPLDRDQQLVQDLVSFYLRDLPPASSYSSSPVQSLSQHRGPVAAPSSSSSSSSFFPELDFPLDYGENYISQVAQLGKQAAKKAQKEYDALSGLDGERRVCLSLSRHILYFFGVNEINVVPLCVSVFVSFDFLYLPQCFCLFVPGPRDTPSIIPPLLLLNSPAALSVTLLCVPCFFQSTLCRGWLWCSITTAST